MKIAIMALVLITITTTTVYGQITPPQAPTTNTTTTTPTPPTTTLTPTTQQIISDVHAACSEVTVPEVAILCVSVIHESPITLVLEGQLLIIQEAGRGTGEPGLVNNPYIWQAVDRFKTQGYTLSSVLLSGEGTQGNPHVWYIVMSK